MKKAVDHASLLLGLLEILRAEAAVHGLLFLLLVVEVFLVLVARGPRAVGGRHGLRSAAAPAATVAVAAVPTGDARHGERHLRFEVLRHVMVLLPHSEVVRRQALSGSLECMDGLNVFLGVMTTYN